MSENSIEERFLARNHSMKMPEEKECPIQRLRYKVYKKTGIWDIGDIFPRKWRYYYYDYIKPIFSPEHKEIRKSISRKWMDLSHVIRAVNFQIIKSFYEKEYSTDLVDWNATEYHKNFANWLESAYAYITCERLKLEKDLEEAYPETKPLSEMFVEDKDKDGKKIWRFDSGPGTYEEKYGEVNRIDAEIFNRDTEVMIGLIKNRDYFWT